MTELAKYAKAIVAALVPAVIMYLTFRTDGMTVDEWEAVATTALAGFGFTWAVPNAVTVRPKAIGGIVPPGQIYVVGENGPESFVRPPAPTAGPTKE